MKRSYFNVTLYNARCCMENLNEHFDILEEFFLLLNWIWLPQELLHFGKLQQSFQCIPIMSLFFSNQMYNSRLAGITYMTI